MTISSVCLLSNPREIQISSAASYSRMVKKVLSYAEVVKGKKEIKKEEKSIVAIKPEKQENVDDGHHWIVVESKKASKAASKNKSDLLSNRSERRKKTVTTIECKCSVADCKREPSSRYRCCDCKER